MTSRVREGMLGSATLWAALTTAAALLEGWFIVQSSLVALVVPVLVAGLATLRLPPAGWIGLALASSWLIRLATETGLAPRPLAFLDFPLVIGGLVVAIAGRSEVRDESVEWARRLVVSMLVVIGAMTISWTLNLSEPQRLIAGILLLLEPFLALVAMAVSPPSAAWRSRLTRLIIGIGVLQVPVALLQRAGSSNPDDIRGTLWGAGAGAHVMTGGLLLSALVVWAVSRSKVAAAPLIIGTLVIGTIADAKQVLFVAPLALVAMTLVSRPTGEAVRRWTRPLLAVTAVVAIAVTANYRVSAHAVDVVQRTVAYRGGKIAVADSLLGRLKSDPTAMVVGFGPGETVSRFAYLTTPLLLKQGSPVQFLGIRQGRLTADLNLVAEQTQQEVGGSSFTYGQSSALGVLGDYGIVGSSALVFLVLTILRAVLRSKDPLARPAVAGWAMLIPLAFVFDWLEQPPFMLMLVVVTALAVVPSPPRLTRELGTVEVAS